MDANTGGSLASLHVKVHKSSRYVKMPQLRCVVCSKAKAESTV
jgi:hypothetical protein